ncbi:carboxypeptidase-like regulatory domain-containing protein [Hymenobacter sp. BT186]|uniref:Carboxypeptidase-like regulatory domain-containing protein n=1 Tax=Hymenobacter telluris TaxID=2816474 RepID=A0A939JE16_9BACT|nr:carboxypeptidase-like regulatory domain-containing protein [Hymenobacter telluris]MBW3375529.1 carboxypeptidase-like regulatory domain-containing protein [Hymenobacter norwichensis]
MLQVQGRVLDKENGLPLPQALIVSLADTTHHTHTDANGHFTLQIPSHLRDSLLFVVADTSPQGDMQGYIGRRIRPANASEIRLRENPNYLVMGEPDPVALEADEWKPKPLPPKMSTIKFIPPAYPLPEQPE